MCDKCGNPDCKGYKEGEPINSVDFTDESLDQAIEILDKLRTMCVNLDDDTGIAQIEGLVKYCTDVGLRADKMLLIMLDLFHKYIAYKSQIQDLIGKVQQAPVMSDVQWSNEDLPSDKDIPLEIPTNKTNKKLN